MDQSINDWLTGEAWDCKPPVQRDSHNRKQEASTLSNSEVPTSSQERDRLVLDALIKYEWPQTLPPRLLHGYTDNKATHMLLRVVVNLVLIGALVYAAIALAPVKAINDDSCLAKATWFESRFFINVVNWKKCRLYGAWLTFAIGYMLVFPTIWAASTGYANSSITAYNLSDKAYVPIDSENLTLCWVTDDVRLSGFLEETIIIGPTFTDAYGFNESEVPGPRTPWRLPPSSHFKDIFFYVSTLNWTDSKMYTYNQEWDGLFFYDKEDFSPPRDVWTSPGFPDILIGSQFSETFPSSSEATFYLNHSWLTYPYLGPGIVPYNSTLMLKNKTLPLPAPFLTFGIGEFNCSWWNSSTGECPCYLGKPLPANWAISDQYVCMSRRQRGLLDAEWQDGSNLIEHNRRNVGTVRHILDLAETINGDLGPNTSVYTDEELQGALLKCPPVGYEVESRNGLKHIGLVTIPHGSRRREKIDMHFDDTYR
ncbi:hypothetical protein EV127DRAFT_414649 [Xylaria flabelliformis]|nr:hypothetical protein EV127DRAFT_414649 [Xylaria flabelliformis]